MDLMVSDYDTTETINSISIEYWCPPDVENSVENNWANNYKCKENQHYSFYLSNVGKSIITIPNNVSQVAITIRSIYNTDSEDANIEIEEIKKANGHYLSRKLKNIGIPVIKYKYF